MICVHMLNWATEHATLVVSLTLLCNEGQIERRKSLPLLFCFLRPCSMACSLSATLVSNSLHLNRITSHCCLHLHHPTLSLHQNLPIYSKNLPKLLTTQNHATTTPFASGTAGKFCLNRFTLFPFWSIEKDKFLK